MDAPRTYGRELFERLRSIDLPAGDFAIFGSGPLLIRRIINTVSDLDVLCRGEAWTAAQSVSTSARVEHGMQVATIGPISFGTNWALGDIDAGRVIDEAEVIEGLPFAPLAYVIAYKRAAGRPKDVLHVALVDEWLHKQRVDRAPG